jgi:hypothetical protein
LIERQEFAWLEALGEAQKREAAAAAIDLPFFFGF